MSRKIMARKLRPTATAVAIAALALVQRSVPLMRVIAALSLVAIFLPPANGATIVYQDTFDNDGIAINTGIGGGLASVSDDSNTNPWQDTGTLNTGLFANNDRAYAYTTNGFDVSNGFTLTVNFQTNTNTSDKFSFGLLDYGFNLSTLATDVGSGQRSWLGTNTVTDAYGIGLHVTTDLGQGLKFNNGSSVTTLSNAEAIPTNTIQDFSLTVLPDGSWSYQVGSGLPTTGTGLSFDLTRDYRFAVHAQNTGSKILHSVTLSTVSTVVVPESSTLILLVTGLATLGFAVWRRKRISDCTVQI